MKKLWIAAFALFVVALAFAVPTEGSDCQDWSGDSRPCTAVEEYDICLAASIDAADQRAASGSDPSWIRFIEFNLDVAVCTASLFSPF